MITQPTLFEVPETQQPKPEIQQPKPEKGRRCRNCKHIYKHQYGTMQYCRLQKQKRTAYGHLKVKANAAACHLFEPEKTE